MEDQCKPVVDHQRRLNHAMWEVEKKEVIKLLDAGIIYSMPHSEWVSLLHCVPKKGGLTVVKNEKNELISQRTVTRWRIYIDYRKLNKATNNDHSPTVHCRDAREVSKSRLFLLSLWILGVHANSHSPDDQHKTTFTCHYGTFAYIRMPFGLCHTPSSFQHCMMAVSYGPLWAHYLSGY
jgi:hypothetical protein